MFSESPQVDPAKVAIYIRWSTEDQGEGTTLEVQTEACRAYVASQGWAVNEELVFIDDGYSGGSLERPAMGRLRRAVADGLVDCVVVYKLDRLSRSVVDTVNLICREWEDRCWIKSAREPIDTTTHAGKMFFYTLVNYAEWERSVIRERTHSGKVRRAQEGRNPGHRPPYGYGLAEGGRFAIVPGEAAVVQRIYQLYLSGMGARQIVNSLNADGFRPRLGNSWTQSTVIKILSNPAYTGRLEYGRRRLLGTGKRVRREPLAVCDDALPPIISKADWEAAQLVKGERPGFGRQAGSGRALTGSSLLTGLLRCRCGHGFMSKTTNSRKRPYYRYYACMGAQQKGSGFCQCGTIRQDLVDGIVLSSLKRFFGGAAARERLVQRVAAQWEQQLAEARLLLAAAEAELGRAQGTDQRIKRMLREGEISVPEYRELKASLAEETGALRERLARARDLERAARSGLAGQDRLRAHLDRVDALDQLTPAGRKQVLRQFVQEIHLYRQQRLPEVACRIVWRWDPAQGALPAPAGEVFEVQQRPQPQRSRPPARDTVTGRFARRTAE